MTGRRELLCVWRGDTREGEGGGGGGGGVNAPHHCHKLGSNSLGMLLEGRNILVCMPLLQRARPCVQPSAAVLPCFLFSSARFSTLAAPCGSHYPQVQQHSDVAIVAILLLPWMYHTCCVILSLHLAQASAQDDIMASYEAINLIIRIRSQDR